MSRQLIPVVLFILSTHGLRTAEPPHPLITPGPSVHPRLFRRSGQTCGWINADSALYCGAGSTCTAITSENVAGGCCQLGLSCAIATACIESASLPQDCDDDCQANDKIAKCSNNKEPYCYTRFFISGTRTPTSVGCTDDEDELTQYIYTTYTYGDGTITFASPTPPSTTPTLPVSTEGSQAAETGSTASTRSAKSTGSAGSTASITSTASDESTASDGSAGSTTNDQNAAKSGSQNTADDTSSGDSPSNNNDDASNNSTPAGAIAGGVVGGLIALGAFTTLIVWIVLRHRRASGANMFPHGNFQDDYGNGPSEPKQSEGLSIRSPPPPFSPMSEQGEQARSPTFATPSLNDRLGTQELGSDGKTHEIQSRPRAEELPS